MPTKRKATTVAVDGTQIEGIVMPEFLSFTMDWWPDTEPGWASSSILHVDLDSPKLINAARGLAPFFLRIGGWEADRVVYLVQKGRKDQEDYCTSNPDFCLTMDRWHAILHFAEKVGARIVFCLNYLLYIKNETRDWDGTNAREFLEYTALHAPKGLLYGIELGNEPLHKGRSSNVTRQAYAYAELRQYIDVIWGDTLAPSRPRLIGPGTTGVKKGTFGLCLQEFGQYLDVATYHDYRGGTGRNPNLSHEAIQPSAFGPHHKSVDASEAAAANLIRDDPQVWIGEGSLAYNSGRENVTNRFQSSFWFANILGAIAKTTPLAHSVFCRQALVGGYYDILSHTDNFEPNPDYWLARLWKEIMGTIALPSERIGCCMEGTDRLLVHAFCARQSSPFSSSSGDVALVLINIAKDSTYEASMDPDGDIAAAGAGAGARLEFLLEAENDDSSGSTPPLSARHVAVNGQRMRLGPDGELPTFVPSSRNPADPMIVPPYSIMFAVLQGARAPSCESVEMELDLDAPAPVDGTVPESIIFEYEVLSVCIVASLAVLCFGMYASSRGKRRRQKGKPLKRLD